MTGRDVHDRIDVEFTLQPVTKDMGPALDSLRRTFKDLAHIVADLTPASREQSLALTELDSSCRWAIAAIIRHQPT